MAGEPLSGNGKGFGVDEELWRWIWLAAAAVMALLEMVTAGFFILPFALGATVAFILAFLNVAVGVQWIAFIVVSILALIGLQTFVRREDEDQPTVGANRFIGQRAIVLEQVDRLEGSGRVRMDTEQWRATTEGQPIEPGTEVLVIGVVGSRLIVQPTEQ